jgi:uncharacterized protein
MRIVIDTNLLVSGVISSGAPRQLLELAKAGEFEICTSEILLTELQTVLSRGKFVARLTQAGISPSAMVEDLRAISIVVAPKSVVPIVLTDPDDDHVLAAALAAEADFIATGDQRDLLTLGIYQGIPIINARSALEQIQNRNQFKP